MITDNDLRGSPANVSTAMLARITKAVRDQGKADTIAVLETKLETVEIALSNLPKRLADKHLRARQGRAYLALVAHKLIPSISY